MKYSASFKLLFFLTGSAVAGPIYTPPPGGSAGGLEGTIQYNCAGRFCGDPNLYWDAITTQLGVGVNSGLVARATIAAQDATITPPSGLTATLVAEVAADNPSITSSVEIDGPADSTTANLQTPTQVDGAGSYFADGSTNLTATLYAYKTVNGTKYYFGTPSLQPFVDNGDSSTFSIGYSWSSVAGADGYVLQSNGTANSGNPVFTIDLGNVTSFSDDGAQTASDPIPSSWSSVAFPYNPGGTAPSSPNTLVPSIIDVGSGSLGPANGTTYNIEVDLATQISGVWYTSGSAAASSIPDQNDSQTFDISNSWVDPGGSETNAIMRVSTDSGFTWTYFFTASLTTFTYSGQANDPVAQAAWGRTYAGPVGTTRGYAVYGYDTSPITHYSPSFQSYSVTDSNPATGYIWQHNISYGVTLNAKILGSNDGQSLSASVSTPASVLYETNTGIFNGDATVTPAHYGVTGTDLNVTYHEFSKQASPLLYSSSFATATTVNPGSGYWYTHLAWTNGGSTTTKFLRNVNSAGFNDSITLSSSTSEDVYSSTSWTADTVVIPNLTTGVGLLVSNSATTKADAAALTLKTTATGVGVTNSSHVNFLDSSDTEIVNFGFDNSLPETYLKTSNQDLNIYASNSSSVTTKLGLSSTIFNDTSLSGYVFRVKSSANANWLYGNGNDSSLALNGSGASPSGTILSVYDQTGSTVPLQLFGAGGTSDYLKGSGKTGSFEVDGRGHSVWGTTGTGLSILSLTGQDATFGSIHFGTASALKSSPLQGDFEFNNSALYLTDSSTRRRLTMNAGTSVLGTNKLPVADGNGNLIDSHITDNGSTQITNSLVTLFSAGLSVSSGQNLTMSNNAQYVGNLRTNFPSFSGTTSLNQSNHSPWSRYTGTGGHTATLPTAASISGTWFGVKNSGTGNLTIATTSSQTIKLEDNTTPTSFTLVPGDAFLVLSDGTNWQAFISPRSTGITGNMDFSSNLTSIVVDQIIQYGKITNGVTIANIEAVATGFTCVSNPTITLYDCGTSAGACTSGRTALASVTLTAANTGTDGTVSVPGLAAGHYWAMETSGGTCTVLNTVGTANYR